MADKSMINTKRRRKKGRRTIRSKLALQPVIDRSNVRAVDRWMEEDADGVAAEWTNRINFRKDYIYGRVGNGAIHFRQLWRLIRWHRGKSSVCPASSLTIAAKRFKRGIRAFAIRKSRPIKLLAINPISLSRTIDFRSPPKLFSSIVYIIRIFDR